ncbi:MAG: hypothetical protein ACR2P2_06060 [Nakamurella sp.]
MAFASLGTIPSSPLIVGAALTPGDVADPVGGGVAVLVAGDVAVLVAGDVAALVGGDVAVLVADGVAVLVTLAAEFDEQPATSSEIAVAATIIHCRLPVPPLIFMPSA